ncbi:signal transducer and activator of transcription 1-alpha/beta [Bombina bombina]|uniref:signal transducer and activator of transcription 1-alpha/beta n=1 Tax=Bombina bombina TaxID=8345 RepID=UPI00235AE091|nr:signal transducer and activator of transcription 1-alpha/beta [Bombina bombina]XP_053564113.1 signal transducer and activator of transcription 1-alpha/beta [Bombina bombina]
MSQWGELLMLTGVHKDQLMALYNQEFIPMEVRQYLAPWIESQDWKFAARDGSIAAVQFQNLLEHLDTQYSHFTQQQEMVQQHNFRRFKLKIQNQYISEPQNLAIRIRDLLNEEKRILLEAQELQSPAGSVATDSMETMRQGEIEQRVTGVKQKVQSIDQEAKFLEDQQETFNFKYSNFVLMSKSTTPDFRLKEKEVELQSCLNELDTKRREILDQVKGLLGLLETLLDFLQQELDEWHKRQKLSCIGAPTNTCLQLLEIWITKTVEAFFQLRHILDFLVQLACMVTYANDPLKTDPRLLIERLDELLHCLLKRSFVVEGQPIMVFPCKRHLVLKTSTKFSVRVRFLVNLKTLKNKMKVSYFLDKDPPNIKGYRKFNLLGPTPKSMEITQGQGLMVEYKHLDLKEQRIGGGGKGNKGTNDGSVSITEELHLITFITQFDYQGLSLELEAVTNPFVIISNISQFNSAWASVIWFNLLSSDPKEFSFFRKPPAAPWLLLAEALSWQFSCCTKMALNKDQLAMLGKKLCDGMDPREDSVVSWNKFSKDNVLEGPFTFWMWFDATLSLVKEHLEKIWDAGYIMGFVNRQNEKALLKTQMTGTFLLRFSESCREGGITFSWVEHQENGKYDIRSVQPYTKKELKSIPLVEIIRNYQLMAEENVPENPLKYLYPNIPRDVAFGEYYENKVELTMEYQKYLKRKMMFVSKRDEEDSEDHLSVPVEEQLENFIINELTSDKVFFNEDPCAQDPTFPELSNEELFFKEDSQEPSAQSPIYSGKEFTMYMISNNDPMMSSMNLDLQ